FGGYVCSRFLRRATQSRSTRLSLLTMFSRSLACADGESREIAKVGCVGIGRVPEFRLDGLQLCQDGGTLGIVGRDPLGGLEIGSVISVLLGFITVYRFLLARRRQLDFSHTF